MYTLFFSKMKGSEMGAKEVWHDFFGAETRNRIAPQSEAILKKTEVSIFFLLRSSCRIFCAIRVQQ